MAKKTERWRREGFPWVLLSVGSAKRIEKHSRLRSGADRPESWGPLARLASYGAGSQSFAESDGTSGTTWWIAVFLDAGVK
jgi:hypothetical protein